MTGLARAHLFFMQSLSTLHKEPSSFVAGRRDVASGVGFGVGSGVGFGVGSGVGSGVGFGVGSGVGSSVGFGVGSDVGRGEARKSEVGGGVIVC